MADDGALRRIARHTGLDGIVDALAGLPPADLQSLMLEVYRRQAGQVTPPGLLARYTGSRFTRPAPVDPRAVSAFEQIAWSELPQGYQPLELSPLSPLGTSSAVATVHQDKVVSTVRNVEVVADSTNVLALECALRRRQMLGDARTRLQAVGLAASQRQVRAQSFGGPREWAHFRLLSLVAAGRARGGLAFEAGALREHLGCYVRILQRWRPQWRVEVALTPLGDRWETLEDDVLAPLLAEHPTVKGSIDRERQSGRGYYVDACYKLYAVDAAEQRIEVGDGGCTTWTRQLLSDDLERLVIGGLGVERLLA